MIGKGSFHRYEYKFQQEKEVSIGMNIPQSNKKGFKHEVFHRHLEKN